MIDVTALIRDWICCSNDLWLQWFASAERGASEFPSIEMALLNAMVLERGGLSRNGLSPENIFERMRAIYPVSVVEQTRQLCVVQRSGNVFCRPHSVSAQAGAKFRVKSIDTMGTMENGRPYVEIEFGDGYILESPDSVEFAIEVG
jgi:hypothetical protein